jgi:alpha-L-rhamnosidase
MNSTMKTINLVLFLLLPCLVYSQDLSLYDLTCEHLDNPLGMGVKEPRLSWKVQASKKNMIQSAYEIRISESSSISDNIFWDSGKVNSSESNLVAYNGPELESTKRYYWQVRIWDEDQHESGWSPAAFWEMGILDPGEWIAKWIEPKQESAFNGPALTLRKDFTTEKKIVRARAYATAHGLYELHINGKKVGDAYFTPGWTNYKKRLQYQAYDITGLLKSGENTVGAMLGDGWFKGSIGWQDNWGYYGKNVALLCQLVLEYSDGSKDIITTDDTWKGTKDGPITLNSFYNGESYDARKELTGWDMPGYDDSGWEDVNIADYGYDEIIASQSVPVKGIQEIKPVKIWNTPDGTLVADMGQNMVGWIKLKVEGPAGTMVTIRHAEVLDKQGEFYTENLRAAEATLRYTLKGGGMEIYEPRFTFMGFRYVAVEGFPGDLMPDNITGVVIHSDMEPTGTFSCSNPLVNQLQHNIQWGQKGNFVDVPTDCPQRDERLGWTGDAQAFIRTAAYNMDVASFFTKWLKDVASDQSDSGAIPFVVPNVLGEVQASAGWADVVTIAPWTIYQVFGDKRLLERQYPSMKKYVDFIRADAGRNYIWEGGSVFGDWLFYKPELVNWTEPDGHTDPDLIATAFYAYSTEILIKAAQELGKEEDVKTYKEVLERIKQAFNNNYVTPAGRTSSDSQTSYVLALMFDLLPDETKSQAVNHLVENIRRRGNHLSTGFLGTPFICHVLSDNGHTDVAYDLLLQETFPSWLYPVKMGATTIWERWDGIKPDSTFQNKGMNSFNHYAYGAIGDWMYRVVAGLEIGSPGYKHIRIRPQPNARLDYAKATYESGYGKIESGWEIDNGILRLHVVVPPNTTAEITLPKANLGKVTEGGNPIMQAHPQAKEVNGNVILEVGSGKYDFEYNTSIAVKITQDAPEKLVELLNQLASKEKNQLLKEHFETVALFTMDTTHGYQISEKDIGDASRVLNFFRNEGSKWETYANGPRPLMMSFKSPTDGKYSYYWLFLPKNFDKKKKDYPFYMELHGSGGGSNNNPRKMLYHPLQPEVAGVTSQGYRKEGLYVYPWGRGDKGYRGIAESDVFEILGDFDNMFKTDPHRQYLYGFSMGGGGTFRIALKSLDRWAAIGVYSGAMRNPTAEEAAKFKDIPVWMTWGSLETRLSEVNKKLKDLLIEAGADVKWTEVEGVGHRYLGEYQEDLMDWFNTKIKK